MHWRALFRGLACLLAASVASLASAQMSFQAGRLYPTREAHWNMFLADFDGDQIKDLALPGSSMLEIMRGKGGTLLAPTKYKIKVKGLYAVGSASGDFDGNGIADVATVFWNSPAIAVFRGTTSGMVGPTWYTNAHPAGSAVAADVNGDGRVDLVTTSNDTQIDVLLNDGAGGFSGPISTETGYGFGGLAAGDLNGDHRADLVGVTAYPHTTRVWLSDGAGGFVTGPSVATSGDLRQPVLAYVNGDTNLDLVAPYLYPAKVQVFLGAGNGTFTSSSLFPVGRGAFRAAAGDLDNDGRTDIVATNDGNSVEAFRQMPDGSFTLVGAWGTGNLPTAILLGDVNRDSKLDLCLASSNVYEVTVLLGRGDGGFDGAPVTHVGGFSKSISLGHFNEDPLADAALAGPGQLALLTGAPTGPLQPSYLAALPTAEWVVTGDFDGDGRSDVAGPEAGITTLLGNGTGGFATGASTPLTGAHLSPAAVGDLNHDGLDDIVVPREDEGDVAILLATGGGHFAASFRTVGITPLAVAVADIDGDAELDVVSSNWDSSDVTLLRGRGDGTFLASIRQGLSSPAAFIATSDLNGQGRGAKVLASLEEQGSVAILKWNGSRLKTALTLSAATPGSIAAGDLNGDGRAEIVVYLQNHDQLLVFRNLGRLSFAEPLVLPAGPTMGGIAIADFDGDEKPDLATVSTPYYRLNDVWLFRNLTPNTN